MIEIKKYEVKAVKKGYSIFRPNKTVVNDIVFETKAAADKYLDRLVLMGWCKK